MTRMPIAETSLDGLRPTGVAGRRVVECWDQIDGYLRGGPGADLANLFAEPVSQGGRIVWFAPEGAAVRPFRNLPADAQACLRDSLAGQLERLDAETRRLLESSNPSARLMGETLERAQQVPGSVEDILYAVGDQPVLVNWGMETEGLPPPVQPLKEFVRRSPPAPPEPPPAAHPPAVPVPVAVAAVRPSMPWWWLLWLLAAATMAAIFYLLLVGCGFWANGRLANFCPAPPAPPAASAPLDDRTGTLMAELAQLEQRFDHLPHCPAPPPPPPPRAPPAPRPEFENRIDKSNAKEGELTITLIWNTPSDLDLYVQCPSGEIIRYNNPIACGGSLDVDANLHSGQSDPVENVYFPKESIMPGNYKIMIRNHKQRGTAPNRFQVRIKKGDQIIYRDGTAPSSPGNIFLPDVTMP